jgi:CHAT domain-containing protein
VRRVLQPDGLAGNQRPTPPHPPQPTRLKILFLAANPTSSSQLNLTREARRIEERIDAGGRRQSTLELVTRWAVRPSDLQRALLEERPHVLHFSGHGNRHSELLFEDDDGNAVHVEKDALVNLIGILPGNLRLVVLNACDTEPIAEALVQHVPCAIGMRAPIDNDAAVAFAASFYQALGFNESVATAFRLGCNELELRRIPEEGIPSLKVRRGSEASRLVMVV